MSRSPLQNSPLPNSHHLHRLFVFVTVVALGAQLGCETSTTEEKTQKSAQGESVDGPLMPVVTDDVTTLLFTYMDERGYTKTAGKPADVPKSVRERVYVVDLSKSPEERQAHKFAFFADLTRKDEAGRYPVIVVSRYDGAKGPATSLPATPDGAVVLYSAQWCGYCKKAKAWFKKNDVAFFERDVEKQPGAQQELTKKLADAKIQAGGIPVIDVAGEIIVGFDKRRLESLVGKMPKR